MKTIAVSSLLAVWTFAVDDADRDEEQDEKTFSSIANHSSIISNNHEAMEATVKFEIDSH